VAEFNLFVVPNVNFGWFVLVDAVAPENPNGNEGAEPPAAAGNELGAELVAELTGGPTLVNKDGPLAFVEAGSAFFGSAGAPNGDGFDDDAEKLNEGLGATVELFAEENPNDNGDEVVVGCVAAGEEIDGLVEDLGAKKFGIEDVGAGTEGADVLGVAEEAGGFPKVEVEPDEVELASFDVDSNVNDLGGSFTTGPEGVGVEFEDIAALASVGLSEG
jgi:hypothetical protein